MKLILQMIGLTMAMLFCGTGALLAGIAFLLEEGAQTRSLAAAGVVIGGAISAVCLWGIIVLNRKWKDDFVRKFDEQPEELLAQWTVPAERWQALAEYEKREAEESAPVLGFVMGAVFGVMTLWGCWSPLGASTAIVAAPAVGAIFGLIFFLGARSSGHQPYFRNTDGQAGEVALRGDGLLILGTLIAWGGFNGSLERFECGPVEGLDFPVLTVEVRKPAGDSNVWHTFRVPLPDGEVDLIETAIRKKTIGY